MRTFSVWIGDCDGDDGRRKSRRKMDVLVFLTILGRKVDVMDSWCYSSESVKFEVRQG